MLMECKKVRPNPLQPRGVTDVSDLVISMEKVGLVQPIVISKGGVLIAGHRRLAAAAKLGWEKIECDVIDLADPKLDIARIMAENEVRQALTGKERAVGFQTMIDLKWTDEDIRSATGATETEIVAARTVATAKKKLVDKMPETISLEEMAGLIEFESYSDAYADLTKNVGSSQFVHRLSYQRQDLVRKNKVNTATDELNAAGILIIKRDRQWAAGIIRLDDYRLKIAPKDHEKCPGHCAYVEHDGNVTFFCNQPKEHGVVAGTGGAKSEEAKKLDKLKRQMRALWRASAPIRQEFVLGQLKGKTISIELLNWAYAWTCMHGALPFGGRNTNSKAYTTSKDARIQFMAICVAAVEKALDDWVVCSGAIGDPGLFTVAYLKMLAKIGYPVSNHEKATIDGKEYVIE
jgi:ParB/RepB/Spo0J family partition protein